MERLIIITGYQDPEYTGEEIRTLNYASKDALLSAMDADYLRILSILTENPAVSPNISDYEHPLQTRANRSTKNLKTKDQLVNDMNEYRRILDIQREAKKTWGFDNIMPFDHYANSKAPRDYSLMGTYHSLQVLTVDEFINDPERLIEHVG